MCTSSSDRYMNHRFPAEIISRGIWLYYIDQMKSYGAAKREILRGVERRQHR